MQHKSCAYIYNVGMPNEFASGLVAVKMCEAAANLGFKTYLLFPHKRRASDITFSNFWDHYQLKKGTFIPVSFLVYEFLNIPFWLESLAKHIRFQAVTWIFSLKALLFLLKHRIRIIITPEREIIAILRLTFWYRPKVIYDVHIEPRTSYERFFDQFILPRVNLTLVTTKLFQKRYLKKGIPESRILFLPMGYDPGLFSYSASKEIARKYLALPQEKFIIGYVGRLETMGMEKGVNLMLKAAKALENVLPIAVLSVGGPERLISKYQHLAKKLKMKPSTAIFRSQIKPAQVPQYLAALDVACLVYPSYTHFRLGISPSKLIEYLAMEKPIIASDFPSITQIVGRKIAYLIKPGQQKEFEKAIIRIWKNPHEARTKARQGNRFVRQFTWEKRQKLIFSHL